MKSINFILFSSFYLMSTNYNVVWPKPILGDKTIVIRKIAYLHNLLQDAINEINEILSIEVFETIKKINFLVLKHDFIF